MSISDMLMNRVTSEAGSTSGGDTATNSSGSGNNDSTFDNGDAKLDQGVTAPIDATTHMAVAGNADGNSSNETEDYRGHGRDLNIDRTLEEQLGAVLGQSYEQQEHVARNILHMANISANGQNLHAATVGIQHSNTAAEAQHAAINETAKTSGIPVGVLLAATEAGAHARNAGVTPQAAVNVEHDTGHSFTPKSTEVAITREPQGMSLNS